MPTFKYYVMKCGSKNKYQNTCVRRDWTTPSKYDDIYYNLINQYVLGDQYDHSIRTSIFHFDNEHEIHRSSRNYKESGLNLILGLHTILN
jgi:hypothetical protein